MSTWLIAGATGGIASATARELAARGYHLVLADRPETEQRLAADAEDLRVRYGATVETVFFDAVEVKKHQSLLENIEKLSGGLDGVLWTVGVMWPQSELAAEGQKAARHHEVNYVSAMQFLGLVADRFEQKKAGMIAAIGSPAGDRGRASNYLYGADKAALHVFMQGLRQRLAPAGVHVLTIKPGPTRTPMTAGMENLPLASTPQVVAKGVAQAIEKRREVAYVPGIWRLIMLVIRHIPEVIFKKMKM
jgi:decaprenylphospho-beta-D-erythro-pentofuranosid-2-ulose 2-reductase